MKMEKIKEKYPIIDELYSGVCRISDSLRKSMEVEGGEIVDFNMSLQVQDKIRKDIEKWNIFINEFEKEKEKVELDRDTYCRLSVIQVGLKVFRRIMITTTGEELELSTFPSIPYTCK